MKLNERLQAIKAEFKHSAPVEVQSVMNRAAEDLKQSGIMDMTLKVGDRVPEVTLPDTKGTPVSLASCLEKGPLVLTFFRGQW